MDIAALSETRLSGEGSLVEEGGGYVFFWKGYPAGEPRHHGVGFAIKAELYSKLTADPIAVTKRIMTLRIPLVRGQYCTIISAYASTLCSEEVIKDQFYIQLDAVISSLNSDDG